MTTFRKGNIRLALHSLASNKGRSFLTMLGIIIGVAAVIVVVCVGKGVEVQVGSQTAQYGKNVLVVQATSSRRSVGFGSGSGRSLSHADIETIRTTAGIGKVVPLGSVVGSVSADHTVNDPVIMATSPEFNTVVKHPIEYGGFFDSEPDSRTAVLGQSIARKLFSDSVPLGQSFTFRGEKFMVAGVFKHFAVSPLTVTADYNEAVFIPYTTARTLLGSDPETYQVLAKPSVDASLDSAGKAVEDRLVAAHGGAQDVTVQSAENARANTDDTLELLTTMTVVVALISFLVGGVGIMNVMLVSVTERTQEVGLRKAIGATNQQILRQFITEAYVLSVFGAVIGVVLASIVVGLLRLYSALQPVVVWQVFVFVPLVAVACGVLFGAFPAAKAARKDPIEALRRQ